MKMLCANMSMVAYRPHMVIIYHDMVHSPIETLYFIMLTNSKNGVWAFDEVSIPLYILRV